VFESARNPRRAQAAAHARRKRWAEIPNILTLLHAGWMRYNAYQSLNLSNKQSSGIRPQTN